MILKQHQFIIWQFWRSGVPNRSHELKLRCWHSCWRSHREFIPLAFPASRGCLYSLAPGGTQSSKPATSGQSISYYHLSGSFFQFPLLLLYYCIKFLLAAVASYYKFTGLTTQIYHLTVLEVGSLKWPFTKLKSRSQKDCTSSRSPKT